MNCSIGVSFATFPYRIQTAGDAQQAIAKLLCCEHVFALFAEFDPTHELSGPGHGNQMS